jgi:CRISPR system Cascade subunit CasA
MPLPAIADSAIRARVDALAADMVRAADLVARLLRRAVRDALFAPGATVKLDWEMLSAVREQLWEATDAAFHEALAGEAARASAAPSPERASWHAGLRGHALVLFDAAAPLAADGATLPKSDDGIRRLLRARRNLIFALQGYGRDGESLFQMLDLSPPQQKKPARKGRAA